SQEDRRQDARRDRGPDEPQPRPEHPDDEGQEGDDDEDPACCDHDRLSLLRPLFPTSRGILPRPRGPAKPLEGAHSENIPFIHSWTRTASHPPWPARESAPESRRLPERLAPVRAREPTRGPSAPPPAPRSPRPGCRAGGPVLRFPSPRA